MTTLSDKLAAIQAGMTSSDTVYDVTVRIEIDLVLARIQERLE